MDAAPTRERVFRALHEIAVAVGGVLEPGELARHVVDNARELLAADAAGLYVLDQPGQVLQPLYSSDAHDTAPEPTITPGAGAAGQAIHTLAPVVVDDYVNWQHAGAWAVAQGV